MSFMEEKLIYGYIAAEFFRDIHTDYTVSAVDRFSLAMTMSCCDL